MFPWSGPGLMMATSMPRSSRERGFTLGRLCICARLSTWKTPIVSAWPIRS